jgi:hypothetical protein
MPYGAVMDFVNSLRTEKVYKEMPPFAYITPIQFIIYTAEKTQQTLNSSETT